MRTLSILVKPASSGCNMRCKYCFYADISNSRKVKNHGIMSFDILETLVRKALSEAAEYCCLGFQGGEPMLAGLEFYKNLMDLEKKYNVNKIKIGHSLQTNGLLIDDEWADFLSKNNFLVGISIDAGKRFHDELRLDTDGKGTYNRCTKAAAMLAKHHTEYNVLSVITQRFAAHPDKVYNFYKQHQYRFIQFIACLDGIDEGGAEYSLSAKRYGDFLCRIFDLWYADYVKGDYFSIRTFDNYIRILAGYPPEMCSMNGVCYAYALVESDGSVYPCDFYAIDQYLLGNIVNDSFSDMLVSEKAKEFTLQSQHIAPFCRTCEYFYICRGGCRREREPILEGVFSLNRYCIAYKTFFSHALPRMQIIANGIKR